MEAVAVKAGLPQPTPRLTHAQSQLGVTKTTVTAAGAERTSLGSQGRSLAVVGSGGGGGTGGGRDGGDHGRLRAGDVSAAAH